MGRYLAIQEMEEEQLGQDQPFFEIYYQEGILLSEELVTKKSLDVILKDVSYRAFPKAVEYRPFKDAELIKMLQGLLVKGVESVKFEYSGCGDNFTYADPAASEQGSDVVRVAHDRYAYFLKALRSLNNNFEQYGEILKTWSPLHDLENVESNTHSLLRIFDDLLIRPDNTGPHP